MRNQAKYLLIYLCVLCFLVGSVIKLAQAEDRHTSTADVAADMQESEISQAQLDQILAPIALYPDTLLSHIFVASTYPLEVVQAARWRRNNKDLDEQEALNAVEKKDWDPSVKALVPFNDLLQKLSDDLEWLQSLGNTFLFDEERVLDTVQDLRQKAYAQGNLHDNDYIDVEQDAGEIVIQNHDKEVVYIPYYDTRHVYGDWWWNDHPPHYWHSPSHYILSAGFYWSARHFIRPSFYFSGFHWHNRHLVADYSYRRNYNNHHWNNSHSRKQRVRVTEYSRWTHNQRHRRGVQYKQNGKRIIRNSENPIRYVSNTQNHRPKKQHQIDKQRVLDVNKYPKAEKRSSAQVKNKLNQYTKHSAMNNSKNTFNKKRNEYRKPTSKNFKDYKPGIQSPKSRSSNNKFVSNSPKQVRTKIDKQNKSYKSQNSYKRSQPMTQSKTRHSANKTSNRSRPVKIERHSKSREKR